MKPYSLYNMVGLVSVKLWYKLTDLLQSPRLLPSCPGCGAELAIGHKNPQWTANDQK